MNQLSRLILVTATAAAVVSVGTVIAHAGWPVPSETVALKVQAAEMPEGVRPVAAGSGPDAVVTWSPQEIGPGTTMQSYLVKRHDAADGTAQIRVFAPVTVTTFTDTAVPAGRWYWTVTPKFAGWLGQESQKSEQLTFAALAAPEPSAPVANPSAPGLLPPEPSVAPPKSNGGGPVTPSAAPPGDVNSPPATTDPELEQPDPPPPPTTGAGSPVELAPPSAGSEDAK